MEAYMGMVLLTGFSFAPPGWFPCDGRLLPISDYEALFNLIGTTYGGDGVNNFALPDLRGRVPVGVGPLQNGQTYTLGQSGGVEQVTVGVAQYPAHTHSLQASSNGGTTGAPANGVLGSGTPIYSSSSSATLSLNNAALSLAAGGSQPHANLQPFQTLNWIICTQGIYPTQG